MQNFLINIFDPIQDWIVLFLHSQPLFGPVFLLFIEEAGIPLPAPGDIFIAYTGYQISKGIVTYWNTFLSLLVAILLGSTVLYFLAYHWGNILVKKYGKYIHLNQQKLEYVEAKFRKYGPIVIILGRQIPGFRIYVTVFAGLSRVNFLTYIISQLISVSIWITIFLQLGDRLGAQTLQIIRTKYSFIFIILIPIIFVAGTILFGKFIPEKKRSK